MPALPEPPVKVSSVLTPMVEMELSFEKTAVKSGLPSIPGPATVTQEVAINVEKSAVTGGIPTPEKLIPSSLMELPKLPGMESFLPRVKQTIPPPATVQKEYAYDFPTGVEKKVEQYVYQW